MHMMKKISLVLTVTLLTLFTILPQAEAHFAEGFYNHPSTTTATSHSIFDGLLKKYVNSSGAVNYNGFKKDKAKLKKYLDVLAKNPPKSNWSRNDKIAYWINAYNAHTIYLVVQKYPISSIMKLNGGNVWNVKKLKVGGGTYTLSQIEKKILIGKYKEPRIHFAINCAAKSCPPLLNRAWKGATLKADLNRQTKKFINNRKYNQISAKSGKLSKIFEWYAKDFGNVKTYINKYSSTKLKSNAKITYNKYDWKLNKR